MFLGPHLYSYAWICWHHGQDICHFWRMIFYLNNNYNNKVLFQVFMSNIGNPYVLLIFIKGISSFIVVFFKPFIKISVRCILASPSPCFKLLTQIWADLLLPFLNSFLCMHMLYLSYFALGYFQLVQLLFFHLLEILPKSEPCVFSPNICPSILLCALDVHSAPV